MQKLFVAGDSISIQYGEYLSELVSPYFLYSRKWINDWRYNDPWIMEGMNWWSSTQLLSYFSEKEKQWFHTEILLFNAWLHDIKRNKITHEVQVTIVDYEKNLKKMIEVCKKVSTSPLRITTTRHDEKIHNSINSLTDRFEKDNEEYHQKSIEIMKMYQIPIIDLRTFTKQLTGNIWSDRVHFTKRVCYKQAQFILDYLLTHNYYL